MKKIHDDFQRCIDDAEARFGPFLGSDEVEMRSPEYLSTAGRKAWHTLAEKYGLFSISAGEGVNRYVIVSKKQFKAANKPILMTPTAQKNFRENFDLKINLCDHEDFEYFVDLFNARAQLNLMLAAIAEFPTEQAWLNHINEVKCRVWSHVKSTDAYKRFVESDLSEYIKATDEVKTKFEFADSYLEKENSGKTFVSIDLRSANYNTMFWFAKEIFMVDGVQMYNWPSFIYQFSKDFPATAAFIKESKLVRQKVFWELEPNRQKILYEYLITKILSDVNFHIKKAYHVGDEIVFEVDEGHDESIREFEKALNPRMYRLRVFHLYQIAANKPWMARKYADSMDIKCCNATEYTMVWKRVNGLPIDPRDLKSSWNHKTKSWNMINIDDIKWLE
jgi:hypothetical protein